MQALQRAVIRIRSIEVPTSLAIAVLVTFVLLLCRVVSVDSPVMASDEYAYFANAKYDDRHAELYRMDPGMQPVDNKLYPLLVEAWSAVSGERSQLVGRIFNALTFAVCGFVLFGIFIRLFDRRTALATSVLYLAAPFSFYATTLLPEVELQLFLYLLALVLVARGRKIGFIAIAMAAVVAAIAYLFKPHAIAGILAAAAYFATMSGDRIGGGQATLRVVAHRLARAAYFLALTFGVIYIAGRILGDMPGENNNGFVYAVYASYLSRLGSVSYLWDNLHGIFEYIGGHLWFLLGLFAPGIALIMIFLWKSLMNGQICAVGKGEDSDAEARDFAVFLAFFTFASVLMIAAFTQSASSVSDFESHRLHGRYLAPIIPFLVAYSLWACGKYFLRYTGLVVSTAMLSFAWIGRNLYKIYPWDYPEAFGLFSPELTHWSLPNAAGWTLWMIVLAAGLFGVVFLFTKQRLIAYIAYLLAVFLASHVQMGRWLIYHNESNGTVIDAAEGIREFMGKVPEGSGLILTMSRYGEASYFLSGLDSLQYVRTLPPDGKFSGESLPPTVSWVITPQSSQVHLPGAAELRFGNQRLYLLDAKYQWPRVGEKADWLGTPLEIKPGLGGQSGFLHGFNDAEDWGAWSSERTAFVELPVKVVGKLEITFFGWVLEKHPDRIVVIKLGNDQRAVRLTSNGAEYRVQMYSDEPSDRLWFDTAVVKSAGEVRGLGVALAKIQIRSAEGTSVKMPAP